MALVVSSLKKYPLVPNASTQEIEHTLLAFIAW